MIEIIVQEGSESKSIILRQAISASGTRLFSAILLFLIERITWLWSRLYANRNHEPTPRMLMNKLCKVVNNTD